MICQCSKNRKLYPLPDWRIIVLEYTPHHYSRVKCLICKNVWIARAKYVEQIPVLYGQKTLF